MAAVTRRAVRAAAPKPTKSDDPAVEDLQRQVAELQRVPCPWGSGVKVQFELGTLTLSTVTYNLVHKLGRKPIGWIVTRQEFELIFPDVLDAVTLYEITSDETRLEIFANGPDGCKITLWVY